ncbi:MAG: asparaginase [Alphaproteobacteria bacterium]|nr:asparaginase [Alphaproteobacteria bacterium]MBP7729781.1 asparaginase [Alphaproteobacteria bacterium]
MPNPIMAEATRGRYQESKHRGAAAVLNSLGHVIRSWGNIHELVMGRSALKLIQALPLIESGAEEAFHLTAQDVALACASHYGEEMHINALETWLNKLGKDERILECGAHVPHYTLSTKKVQPLLKKASVLHNACSGKHLGFLTTALYRNEHLEGYTAREHPVQRRVEQALSEMTDVDLSHASFGIDGCGIPVFAFPLYNIAFAMARFADPSHLHYPRQKAIKHIISAIQAYPEMIAGSDGFDTKLIQASHGQILSKVGAGGVVVGIVPSLGFGIALKIDDGNDKAARVAFLAILRSLGCLDEDLYEKLEPRFPILTHRGKTAGFLQPTHFTTLFPESGQH